MKNILYLILFLVVYTLFINTSDKFIENLTDKDSSTCINLKKQYEQYKCKSIVEKVGGGGFFDKLSGGLITKIGGDVLGAISKEPEECLRLRQELYINKC
jgi:hypothetical protein